MFVIFNKEYRKYNAIMSDLIDKMKKSSNIEQIYTEKEEIYTLDSVDIVLKVGMHNIVVKDKTGAEIISLDCHYDSYDILQNAKCRLFGDFLKKIRNTYDEKIEKASKLKEAIEKARIAEETKQKVISAQIAKEKMLNDALEKLRGL